MLRVEIGNSTCKITGLTSTQHIELKGLLSYNLDPSAAYFSGSFKASRSLLDKRGEFPTGLLYIVKKYLAGKAHSVSDTRIIPPKLKTPLVPKLDLIPYKEQEEAALAAQRATRGVIVFPTGTGKSLIIALTLNALQVKTLVVVPTLELKRQLTKTLKACFGPIVGGFGSTIAVENIDSLDYRMPSPYDCIIIDEFHHSGAKTYRKLNKKAWSTAYYKIGLTATPFRTNDNERLLLESVLSKVIYRLEHNVAIQKKYIVPVEAYYVDVPKIIVEGDTWSEVYSELVVNNKPRNKIIGALLKAFRDSGKNTLCLVKEIQHGNNLLKEVSDISFINGQDDESRYLIDAFNAGKINTLVGTTGIIGEGVDTKPAEYIIIAGLGRSKGAFMQQIGRGSRIYRDKESCKLILFKDASHKWTLNHFKAQCKYLKDEYNIKPVKLDIKY